MAAGAGVLGLGGIDSLFAEPVFDLGKAVGGTPYGNTVAAVEAIGGMERFVSKGMKVAILPNIGWSTTPEQNGNVNPFVVQAVIDMCKRSGAKSITVFCNPCTDIRISLKKSGIQEVIDRSDAWFEPINSRGWKDAEGPEDCTVMKKAQVYHLVSDSDLLINIPVLKHHGSTRLTMAMKNLMGAVKDRGIMHKRGLDRSIPDLNMMIRPQLNILDATRILLRHGPSGGSLDDVVRRDTVFAGINPVEVDALGAELFGVSPDSIRHIAEAGRRKMGVIDTSSLRVKQVKG
jgi:uncharacterized protein (DUF362 family)